MASDQNQRDPAEAPPTEDAEPVERDLLLTPWLRTALLALFIVVVLAGAGVVAGRVGF